MPSLTHAFSVRPASIASSGRAEFRRALSLATGLLAAASGLHAGSFHFSTGGATAQVAMASGTVNGLNEVEAADDFVLTETTQLTSAKFFGLLPSGESLASITSAEVEIYRLFPFDSDTGRTPTVPTRVNSPADVAFDASVGSLFNAMILSPTFTASNSVVQGINPAPNQLTGGEGPVSGMEVEIDVTFATPFLLDPGHYFFVPTVNLTNTSGAHFLWLSGTRPIAPSGTPFAPDLQAWIRDEGLDPDWLRVGTDIVGGGATFNGAFELNGTTGTPTVPDDGVSSLALLAFGLGSLTALRRRK